MSVWRAKCAWLRGWLDGRTVRSGSHVAPIYPGKQTVTKIYRDFTESQTAVPEETECGKRKESGSFRVKGGRLYCTAIMWPCTGCSHRLYLYTHKSSCGISTIEGHPTSVSLLWAYIFDAVPLVGDETSLASAFQTWIKRNFKPFSFSNHARPLSRTPSFLQTIWQVELVSPWPRSVCKAWREFPLD